MRLLSLLAVSLLFVMSSCDKYKGLTQATIYDSADLTNEGCGYLIKLSDGTLEKPVSLPSSFRHDGYKVWVKYKKTGTTVVCKLDNLGNKFYELVEIEQIERDLD